jgi:carbonic anhydrase
MSQKRVSRVMRAESEGDLDRLCESSIKEQVQRLTLTPILQQAWKAGSKVSIHGWVYGLKDGLLSNLDCTVTGPL